MTLTKALLDGLMQQHASLRATLEMCETQTGAALTEKLLALKPQMLRHLEEKSVFYRALEETCLQKNDAASANLGRIFEANMSVQSEAIVRFFEGLGHGTNDVSAAFRTVAQVVRTRLLTEERAVFSLAWRHVSKG